ncbi:MAG: tRNA dihydrouridine synthase DusB [Pseudomonadota bacterium]
MLAPMAGITDLPFRQLVQRFGASLVTSEMVAGTDLLNARPGTLERAELGLGSGRSAVQLAGREPAPMAEAARMLEGQGAEVIDINMGCPAKKVTSGASGAALMREPGLALRIVEAVVGAVAVPVTLKMRLGWDDDSRNAPALATSFENAGITRLAIHGRTRQQFYKGQADWCAISETAEAVTIPVIANGDITTAATARAALKASGAAGVMVGRGAQGRPWALAQIAAALNGTRAPDVPQGAARVDLVARHHEAMLSFYGRDLGLRVARKHLGWYMDDAGTDGPLRRAVLTQTEPAAIYAALPEALAERKAA